MDHEDVIIQGLSYEDFLVFLEMTLLKSLDDNISLNTLINIYNLCCKEKIEYFMYYLDGILLDIFYKKQELKDINLILDIYQRLEVKNFLYFQVCKFLCTNINLVFQNCSLTDLQFWKDLLNCSFLCTNEFDLLKNVIILIKDKGMEYKELIDYIRFENIPLESLGSCLNDLKLFFCQEKMIDIIQKNIYSKYDVRCTDRMILQGFRSSRCEEPTSVSLSFKVSYLDLERNFLGIFDCWNYKFYVSLESKDGYVSFFINNSFPAKEFQSPLNVDFSIYDASNNENLLKNSKLSFKWDGLKKSGFENVAALGYLLKDYSTSKNNENPKFHLKVLIEK